MHCILILMDGLGSPTYVLGAEEVTGYWASMNAMVPFSWRNNVDNIVISVVVCRPCGTLVSS